MPFLTQSPEGEPSAPYGVNKTNWKFLLIVVVFAIIVGVGIWGYLQLTEEKFKIPPVYIPEKIIEDKVADWKNYMNEDYGFKVEYPLYWFLESSFPGRLAPGQTEFRPGINPQFFHFGTQEFRGEVSLYVAPSKRFECPPVVDCDNALCSETIIDGIEAKVWVKEDIKEVYFCKLDNYFRFEVNLKPSQGTDIAVEKENIFNQMLSTFRFIEFPREIKSDENFIEWLKDWQISNPSLTVFDFLKEIKIEFPIYSTLEEQKVRAYCFSEHFSEAREFYSPDKTKSVYFPCNPGEPDLDVWLYNRNSDGKMELISSTGPSAGYDSAFWIDNNRFVILAYFWETQGEVSIYVTDWDLINKTKIIYKASGLNSK